MKSWGFEDYDDEPVEVQRTFSDDDGGAGAPEVDAALRAVDSADVVGVGVDEAGQFVSVTLWPQWKTRVDPRQLHTHVTEAANAVLAQSIEKQAEEALSSPHELEPAPTSTETGPLSAKDARRLIDTAMADINAFVAKIPDIGPAAEATAHGAGGHVTVAGVPTAISRIEIDHDYAYNASITELQAELLSALVRFAAAAEQGPESPKLESPALTEINALFANPEQTLRRLGLPTPDETVEVSDV